MGSGSHSLWSTQYDPPDAGPAVCRDERERAASPSQGGIERAFDSLAAYLILTFEPDGI